MRVKVISARFKNEEIINRIEEDYLFFQQTNYAIQDYIDNKGYYELDIYLSEETDEKDIFTHLHQRYPELQNFSINYQNQEDWFEKWKQSLKPIWLTGKFLVDPAINNKDEIQIIKITPGMAFGTGYHETTRLTAELLQEYGNKGDHMLDLGCGSGILTIMGAKSGCLVTAVDLESFAVEATRENIRINSVSSSVKVMTSDLLEEVHDTYDIICANILYDILKRLFVDKGKDLKRLIHRKTTLIFSGLILKQYEPFKELVENSGFTVIKKLSEGDWFTIAVRLKKTEVI
ncbi:MAG: 50S ribosomal protein L11 methyltransferase [Thermotogota bacterium]|nr:50S ribosomal protein L11 methyltransferase [Thermotogota bacterium]